MAMEFWGVEVKAGQPLKVEYEEYMLLHLSQASLGEAKKDKSNESAVLYVTVGGKKLVIGTLSADKCPQISYDLVFEKEIELSHNWKHGSVYFCGYRAEMQGSEDEEMPFSDSDEEEEEEEEEEVPAAVPANGKPESKADKSKVLADKSKAAKPDSKVKNSKPNDESESEDDDSDDKDDDSVEDESDDEDMLVGGESEDEESSDEEEEETPKNVKKNKKRAAEPASKSPAPEKKAKLVTPQKSGGDAKKATPHTATPHPSKGGKTNTKADKSKQSPKSGGQVSCKGCSKTFNSDGALQSHTKAKHSDSK